MKLHALYRYESGSRVCNVVAKLVLLLVLPICAGQAAQVPCKTLSESDKASQIREFDRWLAKTSSHTRQARILSNHQAYQLRRQRFIARLEECQHRVDPFRRLPREVARHKGGPALPSLASTTSQPTSREPASPVLSSPVLSDVEAGAHNQSLASPGPPAPAPPGPHASNHEPPSTPRPRPSLRFPGSVNPVPVPVPVLVTAAADSAPAPPPLPPIGTPPPGSLDLGPPGMSPSDGSAAADPEDRPLLRVDAAGSSAMPPQFKSVDSPPLPPGWMCVPDRTHYNAKAFTVMEDWWGEVCKPEFNQNNQVGWPFRDVWLPPRPPTMKTLLDLAVLLKGRRVAVLGDSMMQQTMDAMECEARLTGVYASPTSEFTKSMHSSGAKAPLGIQPKDHDPREPPLLQLHLRGDRKYNRDEVLKTLNTTIDTIIVFFGLHEPDEHEYRSQMKELAQVLDDWMKDVPGRIAMFKEMSAQHFSSDKGTGKYDDRDKLRSSKDNCRCSALRTTVEPRNEFLHDLLRQQHPKIKIIPFWDLTAPRYNMHHESAMSIDGIRSVCDCTHFCFSPEFYRREFDLWYKTFQEAGL